MSDYKKSHKKAVWDAIASGKKIAVSLQDTFQFMDVPNEASEENGYYTITNWECWGKCINCRIYVPWEEHVDGKCPVCMKDDWEEMPLMEEYGLMPHELEELRQSREDMRTYQRSRYL